MNFNLGNFEELKVIERSQFGLYLAQPDNDDTEEKILLPNKEVTDAMELGDILNVFIYKDHEDRYTATTTEPKIKMGEISNLEVIDINDFGAFLDWGLGKDLLLPYDEQNFDLKEGDSYLVMLQIDDQDRLYATMKIYQNLSTDHDFEVDDEVDMVVYQKNPEYGAFVAVEDKYHGLILNHDIHQPINVGDRLTGRVTQIDDDSKKLIISLKKKIPEQMDEDSEKIYSRLLESDDHTLMLHDKSNPHDIKRELNMSKRAFKRAIGKLYKERKIEFIDQGIKLID